MSRATHIQSSQPPSRLLCVGAAFDIFDRVAAAPSGNLASIDRLSWDAAGRMPDAALHANLLLLAPEMPPPRAIDDVSVEDVMTRLDEPFLVSAQLVKQLVSNPHPRRRVVFLLGWSIHGLSQDGVAAFVAGGSTGLARSWASELDQAGITANVVVTGAVDDPDIVVGAAHAALFFMAPAAASITGQILSVAGPWSTGTLPV